MTSAEPVSDAVAAVRRFNRFHTRWVGMLDEQLYATPLSLPQLRLIWELANADADAAPSAAELGAALGMDAGHLSRLVSGLEAAGLLERLAVPGRRQPLRLTDEGRRTYAGINAASAAAIEARLAPLSDGDRAALIRAMARIESLLGAGPVPGWTLRAPRPGDLGAVITGQARLYAEEYGWDQSFEALVADILARFVQNFVPGRERGWIADSGGAVVGSVFVVQAGPNTAKLRLLYVDRSQRGRGLGRALVDEAMGFARGAGYGRMELWTNDILVSARRIYQAAGFELVSEEPHHSFGKDLVGQVWARPL